MAFWICIPTTIITGVRRTNARSGQSIRPRTSGRLGPGAVSGMTAVRRARGAPRASRLVWRRVQIMGAWPRVTVVGQPITGAGTAAGRPVPLGKRAATAAGAARRPGNAGPAVA